MTEALDPGTPLDPRTRDLLLRYVRERLDELDRDPRGLMEGVDIRGKDFEAGLTIGRESAYHDMEHILRGQYGPGWE